MILENTIKEASKTLKHHKIISHELDAQIILSNILGVSKEFLLLNNDIKINERIKSQYNNAIKRRLKHEPVAYIIGKKEFWSKNFLVNKSTLVPRPETELLICKIVKYYRNKKINVLDIGTGSGCILLSILKELRNSRGIGLDISKNAIRTAIINSKNLKLSNRSKFIIFDIKNFYLGKYDLIVSNPPYIPSRDIRKLSLDIRNFEPLIALNGGHDGLDLIKKVIYKSSSLLKKNGLLAIEIGNKQYLKVSTILTRYNFRVLSKIYDYKSNVRCIISTKK